MLSSLPNALGSRLRDGHAMQRLHMSCVYVHTHFYLLNVTQIAIVSGAAVLFPVGYSSVFLH